MCVKAPVLVGGLLIFYRRQFSGGLIKPMNGSKAHQGGRCFQWRHRIVHSSIDRIGHIIPGHSLASGSPHDQHETESVFVAQLFPAAKVLKSLYFLHFTRE